ncbi:MAG: hypothetical protein HZA53_16410 [Planctomycetes bacterium]|nr:hypothetical protein [Planctomycetota bacterium]
MIRKHTLLLPSLLAITAAFVAPADTLAFKVEAKAKLSKTFDTKLEMHSTEMSMTFDGNDHSGGMGDAKVTVTSEEHMEITDEYGAIADGRPTKLVRTFDKLSGKSGQNFEPPAGIEADSHEESKEESSKLEGKKVVLTWKDDECSAAWAEGEKGDDELLEKLDGDLDFIGFLPSKPVAEGDTWNLEAKLFRSVMSPSGRLHLEAAKEGDEEGPDEDDQFQETIEKNLTGKATATYKGTREEGGVTYAVIEVKADLSSNGTLDQDEGKAALDASFELEGEVLWNPKAGHLRSFKLGGKFEFGMESSRTMQFDEETHEFSQKVRFEGEVEYKASIE